MSAAEVVDASSSDLPAVAHDVCAVGAGAAAFPRSWELGVDVVPGRAGSPIGWPLLGTDGQGRWTSVRSGGSGAFSRIRSAARSATIIVGA